MRKQRRPWIKILDASGRQMYLNRNPSFAVPYLVIYRNPWNKNYGNHPVHFRRFLYLDDKEYNAPVKIVESMPGCNVGLWANARNEVLEDLKYLIDLHKAFYY